MGTGDAARFESTDHGRLQEGHSIAAEKWVGRNAGGTLRSSCFSSRSCLFISLVLQLRELLTNALDTISVSAGAAAIRAPNFSDSTRSLLLLPSKHSLSMSIENYGTILLARLN